MEMVLALPSDRTRLKSADGLEEGVHLGKASERRGPSPGACVLVSKQLVKVVFLSRVAISILIHLLIVLPATIH